MSLDDHHSLHIDWSPSPPTPPLQHNTHDSWEVPCSQPNSTQPTQQQIEDLQERIRQGYKPHIPHNEENEKDMIFELDEDETQETSQIMVHLEESMTNLQHRRVAQTSDDGIGVTSLSVTIQSSNLLELEEAETQDTSPYLLQVPKSDAQLSMQDCETQESQTDMQHGQQQAEGHKQTDSDTETKQDQETNRKQAVQPAEAQPTRKKRKLNETVPTLSGDKHQTSQVPPYSVPASLGTLPNMDEDPPVSQTVVSLVGSQVFHNLQSTMRSIEQFLEDDRRQEVEESVRGHPEQWQYQLVIFSSILHTQHTRRAKPTTWNRPQRTPHHSTPPTPRIHRTSLPDFVVVLCPLLFVVFYHPLWMLRCWRYSKLCTSCCNHKVVSQARSKHWVTTHRSLSTETLQSHDCCNCAIGQKRLPLPTIVVLMSKTSTLSQKLLDCFQTGVVVCLVYS